MRREPEEKGTWFAWYPVRTKSGRLVWMKRIQWSRYYFPGSYYCIPEYDGWVYTYYLIDEVTE